MNQFELNKAIEKFILEKDARGEKYSAEDIHYIQQYEGSGGQGKKGATGEGLLYEFYTPDYIVELMWELAHRYGYHGGYVLEPSIATGRLIEPAPDKSKCVGFEINPLSARIAEITYPEAKIYRGYFETAFLFPPRFTQRIDERKNVSILHPDGYPFTLFKQPTWLAQYPFSLVIGNPPYGKYRNTYSSYFPTPKILQIEIFFMYYGLQLLKKGGLLIYLTSSNFLSNGISYTPSKELLGKFAEMVDAYRLPAVFRFSEVPTDILVFRRK